MAESPKKLAIGDLAPDFSLPNQDGEMVKLSSLRGSPVVLYFYPKDNTPGCTKEACAFRDTYSDFANVDAVVIGISKDSVRSHKMFAEKHRLPFTLLSDPDLEVCKKYGVYQLKRNFGKESWGIVRSTFLIDSSGKIARIWRNVRVNGHVEEVKAVLSE